MKPKQHFTTICKTCGKTHHLTGDATGSPFILYRVACKCGSVFYHEQRTPRGRVHDKTLALHRAILEVFVGVEKPVTVRQMYYLLAARHAVPKTEPGYTTTQKALAAMRRNGSVPFAWVADSTRTSMSVNTYDGLSSALSSMQSYYRRNLWAEQTSHIEIWCEKRTLLGVLNPVCAEWGVRLYATNGYPSISQLYDAALDLAPVAAAGKTIRIFQVGDGDADGEKIADQTEEGLRDYADFDFHFERLALLPEQIARYGLHDALRPQKRSSNAYDWWIERNGGKESLVCDLEAMHPNDLRTIVRNAIVAHIDAYSWNRLQMIEKQERETLGVVAGNIAQWASTY